MPSGRLTRRWSRLPRKRASFMRTAVGGGGSTSVVRPLLKDGVHVRPEEVYCRLLFWTDTRF
jgi:hypothetical protein